MSPPRLQSPRLPGRSNDQRHDQEDPRHHTASHSRRGGVFGQDPFAYYKAFLDTETSSTHGVDQHRDGGTWCQPRADAQSALGYAGQQENRPRPVPHSVAVRLANRTNGAPLATIVEQGSVSTLNSHGSLLGVGRFPSIRAVESASPGHASHRHTQSLDDAALNRIQEEEQEQMWSNDTNLNTHRKEIWDSKSKSYHAKATAARSVSPKDQKSPVPQIPELDLDVESTRLKGFFRGVVTKVRSNTRSCPRSSTGTDAPFLGEWSDVSPSVQSDRKATLISVSQGPLPSTSASTTPSLPHHVSKPQTINGSSPETKTKPLTYVSASPLHGLTSTFEPQTAPIGLQLPPLPDLSRLQFGKELLPSACSVPPPPRNVALDHVRHAATTVPSRSREELATRYAPEGASAQRGDGVSLDDFARNASRNASFCSTMSTSYSGTVLGIDLDMQHDFPHLTRRSFTSVWFNPKEAEKFQEPRKRALQLEGAKPLRPRSITSFALTSLLPIAAAEGIVQQNLTTPQLTFYSPSGNVIQAQHASPTPPPTSSSHPRFESYFSGTPTTTTSFYNSVTATSAQSALSAAVAIPPARPALLPLTTPPQLIAPLPEHLRCHHNYHKVDKSLIESMYESQTITPSRVVVTSDSQVSGCGGVVRPPNLDPLSGVLQSPPKSSKIGSYMSRLCMRDKLAISNLSFLAPNSSSKPKRGHTPAKNGREKGKTLQKRRVPHMDAVPEQDFIGPAAGHALRVCFCQPYDGVGRQTTGVGCGGAATMQLGEGRAGPHASPTGLGESTPNARIVAEVNGKGKDRARRDSVVSQSVDLT